MRSFIFYKEGILEPLVSSPFFFFPRTRSDADLDRSIIGFEFWSGGESLVTSFDDKRRPVVDQRERRGRRRGRGERWFVPEGSFDSRIASSGCTLSSAIRQIGSVFNEGDRARESLSEGGGKGKETAASYLALPLSLSLSSDTNAWIIVYLARRLARFDEKLIRGIEEIATQRELSLVTIPVYFSFAVTVVI